MYGQVMWLRNKCFDLGWLEQRRMPFPVVSVGNLAVGGTGKTPMVELLVRGLRQRGWYPVVVSRGYGRATHGPLLAESHHTARDIGDEPMQIYRKLQCPVIVSEDRRKAQPLVEQACASSHLKPIVILDDAYQHRYVHRDCNILLTDYGRRYTTDHVLPWGRLRELRVGARRAHIIVVTKCPPTLSETEADAIRAELSPTPGQMVFFSCVDYDAVPRVPRAMLLTGIANPRPLVEKLKAEGVELTRHMCFPDHHSFTQKELDAISRVSEPIITTEKDAVRLPASLSLLPIGIRSKMLFQSEELYLNTIQDYVNHN